MSAAIAKTSMGFCSCGLQIEPNEQILMRPEGAIHVGCPERTCAAGPMAPQTESSGFLFSDMERAIVDDAKETIGIKHVSFDGASVLGIDTPRLSAQLAKVFNLMRDSRYRTLSEIAAVVGCLETSASARLRDFRKARFGSHTVISRRVANLADVYEYRLILREKAGSERRNAA